MMQDETRTLANTVTEPAEKGFDRAALLSVGGIVAALGAATCCVLPFALFFAGISGAWIGNLTALGAYQPIFLGVAVAFLAAGFWRVYRRPRAACAEGECGTPSSNRLAKTALWLATVLIGLAVLFPYLAPLFLEV